jgi:hypothetical protein
MRRASTTPLWFFVFVVVALYALVLGGGTLVCWLTWDDLVVPATDAPTVDPGPVFAALAVFTVGLHLGWFARGRELQLQGEPS